VHKTSLAENKLPDEPSHKESDGDQPDHLNLIPFSSRERVFGPS
jgi:hypothetical protein